MLLDTRIAFWVKSEKEHRAAAVSPKLKSIKKYGKVKYPLLVKLESELDLEGIGRKYNCKMFTRINGTMVLPRNMSQLILRINVTYIAL